MMKVLAAWIMRGPWQATLVVVTATLLVLWLPVLSPVLFLSGAALALVVLRQGAARALKVLLLAMIAGSVLTLFITGSIMPLVWLVLIYWLPLLGLAVVLRITISLDTTVRLLAIAGALAVIVFYLTIGEPSGWLTNPSQQATEAFSADTGIDQTTMLQWLQVVETLVPGLFVASLLMSLLAALLLARWWQSLLYNPGGFRKEFHQLRLGKWLAIIMIVLFVATLISGADVPLIARITARLTRAPGNDAPIGGLKVVTENGWFAARPSGTEDVSKIYAESFLGEEHLRRIQKEAARLIGS
jgi:hypothetical protein